MMSDDNKRTPKVKEEENKRGESKEVENNKEKNMSTECKRRNQV